MITVRTVVLESGERLPMLIGDDGLPDPHLTHYAIASLRQNVGTAKSIEHHLRALLLLRVWEKFEGIDAVERCQSFEFLSASELIRLKDHLMIPLRRHRKMLDGSVAAQIGERPRISRSTAQSRYDAISRFLFWLGDDALSRISSFDSPKLNAAKASQQAFRSRVKANRRMGATNNPVSKPRYGLLEHQRKKLLEVIHPDSLENPFQSVHRHRNYALILMYFEFGMRLGELLSLRVVGPQKPGGGRYPPSVDLTGQFAKEYGAATNQPSIWITRFHDDPEDPRKNQPVVKTLSRLLYFKEGGQAHSAVQEWVQKHRKDETRYPGAKRSPFLFVSRRAKPDLRGRLVAQPLSLRRTDELFERIRERHPELKDLCAHVLRHDWNDRLNEFSEANGISADEIARDQKYQMGWSPTSTMPDRYGRRSIQKLANERSLSLQRDVMTAQGLRNALEEGEE
ncbi:MAG: site-specific integrase [Alphaproteobacteria bacterium]|nr:site-specific integrase [Alphaproteobacteria bacterium]